MADDAVFRSSLVCLAAVIVGVGLYTQSFKKVVGTYLFGMFGICGLLLPDWDYFDRPISQWCTAVCVDDFGSPNPHLRPTIPSRFRIYPIRLIVYTAVYGFCFYKWWMFVSN